MTIIIQSETRLVTIVQGVQAVLCLAVFVLGIYKFSAAQRPSRTDMYPIIVVRPASNWFKCHNT